MAMLSISSLVALALAVAPTAAVRAHEAGAAGPARRTTATGPRVRTANGLVEGVTLPGGVEVFKGIPYAAPPVRGNRWKPPQPVASWTGVRRADRFAAQCMQMRVFNDMVFRNSGVSEDCLYLNVWTPSASRAAGRPVLVYFFGGGYVAGDGSEFRYDGASLARKGIVVVTMSYRLGIFGFFADSALARESPHHAAGDYGLLDQVQALRWVRRNIAAFGGDPSKVTIGGESAGSISVSALMASPLARGLFRGAIGESGSLLGALPPVPLARAEAVGQAFGDSIGAPTLAEMRAVPAMELLLDASRPGAPRFPLTVDGYLLPESPDSVYAAGRQAHVPLLVGGNSEEMSYPFIMHGAPPTPANFTAVVQRLYGDHAAQVLRVFPDSTDSLARASATALASARFIAFSTWKWAEMQRLTGGAPVYRYLYAHPRPPVRNPAPDQPPPPEGAVHSAEIEYALGNLATNHVYAWTADDYAVSHTMEDYFANFVRTGNPNGPGLPQWPQAGDAPNGPVMIMRIDVHSHAMRAPHRDRYLLLDRLAHEP